MARTIAQLKALGLSKNQILDRLNGAGNNRDATRAQLREIGFEPNRVNQILQNQRAGRATWNADDNSKSALEKALAEQRRSPSTPSTPTAPPTPAEESFWDQPAYAQMAQVLKQYGLDSLTGTLRDLISDGITDEGSLTLALQDTDAWRQRFIGNETLRKNGLPVMGVAEYLATERSYAQIMRNYGLPQGFYDDPADFGDFIGKGISPNELQERVQSYADLAQRDDPAIKEQLRAMGMSEGDLLAFYMDPDRANPLIQKKYKATLIGAAARRTGMSTTNEYAERLAGMGITEQQAQAGYAMISENLGDVDRLGDIYGVDYDQRDFEGEVFEGDGDATRKRKRLASQERAAFSGSSGVSQGSLRQSSAGQY